MNKNLIEQAQSELADIEQKIAAVEPLRPRREQLRAWLALTMQIYPDIAAADEPAPATTVKVPASATTTQMLSELWPDNMLVRRRTTKTQKELVVEAATEIILAEGPMLSRAIAERMKARGIELGGADPASAVSSILSRDDKFESDRAAGGWVLTSPHKETPPPGAPTPAGA